MSEQYKVKIDQFEGPLDVLLHFVQQAEMDIQDIPLAAITDQYLQYVRTMQELELDVAGEYLVMAATLLQIKSQTLLPVTVDEDTWMEEEDPKEQLIEQLEEYKRYKEAAGKLQHREQEQQQVYKKPLSEWSTDDAREEGLPDGLTVYDMVAAFQKMKERAKNAHPPQATVRADEYSVEERMTEVMEELERLEGCSFYQLFAETRTRPQMVVTFLALLELMKQKQIRCEQANNFDDITIQQAEKVKA
ncbi:segregation/condensation protein A [Marinococcus halophilus]|uniref:segregation/condensation protein A n=1 Tax=Marinococcus halophilus TaxID=1371 RepID=UPI0009A6DA4A|nr:segregation/condensation protein A [Marinococcus halophilus]